MDGHMRILSCGHTRWVEAHAAPLLHWKPGRQAGGAGGAAHLIGNRPTAAAWLLPVRRPADMDGEGDNLMLLGERRGN